MNFDKKSHRRKLIRLRHYDYSQSGAYFITICAQNRECLFGDIIDGEMQLNKLGELTELEWIKSIELRPDMNLELGNFVVMPNHFHGILIIGENKFNAPSTDAMHRVSTAPNDTINKFGPQSKNLASILRGFKSAITTQAKKMGIHDFAWQTRFHDHIIRDAQSFENIQNYIANNPANWGKDTFNNTTNV